jgi:GR25 family glycosyltransferase involved in LPS biosynthesis
MKIIALLLMTSIMLRLDAGIEKHFRAAENKSGAHGMPGIDFIYVINLDQRPKKFERTLNALAPYGINPYRFSAVNGWKLSFEALDEIGVIYESWMPEGPLSTVYRHVDGKEYMSFEIMKEVGVSYFSHTLSRGAIGCLLSHLSVLQDAYDSGYHTIWVLEDDIRVVSNPLEISSYITTLDHLAPGWDIFFTDGDIKGGDGSPSYCNGILPRPNFPTQSLNYYRQRTYVNNDIVKLGLRFGSHSMVIRRSGMKKLLDYFKTYKVFFPYDLEYYFPHDIKLYASIKDIVTNIAGGESDNGTPAYEK